MYSKLASKFGSGMFLLVQVVLLFDFVHRWNDVWVKKDEQFWLVEFLYPLDMSLLYTCKMVSLDVFIVKIAHARGVCKRQDALSKLKVEREQLVERMNAFLRVVTSIPGIDKHDANAVILFCHYVLLLN
ncbi:hypothetical protein IFM89_015435 [Coptis chinensis]|uniref:Uncharacterized protein n=1 Tax=Coptis chinensis TaxID=261450 RepID=A0A835MIE8_9MAGN|nr:hypothetical protein IFM89_015435 [Coptis chinensis]